MAKKLTARSASVAVTVAMMVLTGSSSYTVRSIDWTLYFGAFRLRRMLIVTVATADLGGVPLSWAATLAWILAKQFVNIGDNIQAIGDFSNNIYAKQD